MIHTLLKNKMIQFFLASLIGILWAEAYAGLPKEHQPRLVLSTQSKSRNRQELIVLVHGLLRTSLSMWPLKMYLEKKGYQVYSYSYPSAKYTIQEHGVYFNQFIKKLITEHPELRISFVTHSLGGILTREALSRLTDQELKHIACVIMLAPPNQGSTLAKLSSQMFPLVTGTIKPLAELSSDRTAYVHRVPVPPRIRMGIIAGRYDAKVPPEFAQLLEYELKVVNSNHTFIMNNRDTKRLILSFLKNGTFAPTAYCDIE